VLFVNIPGRETLYAEEQSIGAPLHKILTEKDIVFVVMPHFFVQVRSRSFNGLSATSLGCGFVILREVRLIPHRGNNESPYRWAEYFHNCKGKGILSLCLLNHHTMSNYRGVKILVQSHAFLTKR
jgi:hypothetical protein